MPRLRFRFVATSLAGLAIAAAPALVRAQDAPHTVTVKRGDTLWDLAKQYLGDSYLWPEIYRLNAGAIEDPHWIYPGQQLRLPGAAIGEPMAEAPAAVQAPTRGQQTRMTVFNPEARKVARQSRESLILRARATAVRPGEYMESPFMWSDGGPKDSGFIRGTAESQGVDFDVTIRPIGLREHVALQLPKGARGAVGDTLLVYRLGEVVEGQGQVVIPTGIVRIVTSPIDGAAMGDLLIKYEDVFPNQRLAVFEGLNMPAGKFPQRVEFGLASKISWMYSQPVLPGPGQYLILSAAAKDGLVPGDQVSLRRNLHENIPDIEIGVAQITRVTQWGASAIVIELDEAGIRQGMRAQLTAKMP